jgi:DNA-binding NarL/FixJ family response regulator
MLLFSTDKSDTIDIPTNARITRPQAGARGVTFMAISLVVAATSALANEMLCRAFKQRGKQFKVVACALSPKDLLKEVAEHQPDVALFSASLEDEPTAGLQVLRELRLARLSTRPIVILDCSEPEQVIDAFSHGARGVLCKSEGFEVLCKCIRNVHTGQVWADSSQLQWVVQALAEREPVRIVSAAGTPLLTKREEQIVRMVAEGLPSSEISRSLRLSAHTVKNHLFRIYEKLGVSTRVELVLYALRKRDVPGGGDDPFERLVN